MRCGPCGVQFNSWLKLQYHNKKEHQKDSILGNLTPQEFQSQRKEQGNILEEKLKDEISKHRYYNT